MLVDPNKCVIFNHSIIEEKEDTLEEKKLKRLINLRDKCDDRYGILTIYSFVFEVFSVNSSGYLFSRSRVLDL